jgi:cell division septation protein DedD
MSRSYYVIELSARWLTVLLLALAVLMVLAFGLGYGAAWSVVSNDASDPATPTPTPLVTTEILPEPTAPVPTRTRAPATPRPKPPTAVPPTEVPATPTPEAKTRPTERPDDGFWVQVMASAKEATIAEAGTRLVGLGFDRAHQKVVRSEVAGGNELIKLRVGPFPDRASADRVLQRMRAADFPDAWVVVPE